MIRQDEVFFQVQTGGAGVKPAPTSPSRKGAAAAAPRH
jgi:hypothetical protein